jgi:hypothetical protein
MRQGMAALDRPLRTLLVLSAVVCFGAAQAPTDPPALPEARLGVRTAPILLLSRPDVRSDLQLSQSLAPEIERVVTDLWCKADELRGKKDGDAVNARRLIDDAQQQWLTANLTPSQIDRLRQIDLQWEGPSALVSRSNIQSIVKLTEEQHKALSDALARRKAERAAGKVQPKDEIALGKQAMAILSPEQRERWLRLLGRPCAFQTAPVVRTAGESAPTASVRR